jgi:hypothetical protein
VYSRSARCAPLRSMIRSIAYVYAQSGSIAPFYRTVLR